MPKDGGVIAAAPDPFDLPEEPVEQPDPAAIAAANALIGRARAPVLYFGGGVAIARAERALREFAKRSGIPSVSTLKGLGALSTDTPGFLRMLGMHRSRAANMASDRCDLLICVCNRFHDRATCMSDT